MPGKKKELIEELGEKSPEESPEEEVSEEAPSKDKYTCACGSVINNKDSAIAKHELSKKHLGIKVERKSKAIDIPVSGLKGAKCSAKLVKRNSDGGEVWCFTMSDDEGQIFKVEVSR